MGFNPRSSRRKVMSEIESVVEILSKALRSIDKRLNNLEGNKVNTEGLDLNQLTEEVASNIKDNVVCEVASFIDVSAVAENLNQADIVEEVAQYYGAEGIAEHVPTDQVAEHIDVDYKKLCQVLIQSFMADKECK